jgi:4-hydroxybenzoate polyprenyltransferase
MHALQVLLALRHGRAAFKAAVADRTLPDVAALPMEDAVLSAIQQARGEGRRVYLATAADKRFGEAVAAAVGGFAGVFATENGINLKGQTKADCLVSAFGYRGFDYIGNSNADVPVWNAARTPLIVGASARVIAGLSRVRPDTRVIGRRQLNFEAYLRALRPHQWLKNCLIALPAIAGHDHSLATLITVLIAFASFSLGASSVYLINDMIDLPHDRLHVEKRHRPFAAGTMPLSHGVVVLAAVASLALALALLLPWAFFLVLAVYFGLSMAYAFYLKRKLMIDVVALAALYGIRVLAGGAATGIVLSHWLVGFCFFIFLSLALVKRTTEMIALPKTSAGNIKGRGYRRVDLPIITALTAASGFVAVLVLSLYIASPDVTSLYRRPQVLWGICVILVYWIGRVCFLTGRGEMRQDPVVFAATDKISLITGVIVAAIFLAAL